MLKYISLVYFQYFVAIFIAVGLISSFSQCQNNASPDKVLYNDTTKSTNLIEKKDTILPTIILDSINALKYNIKTYPTGNYNRLKSSVKSKRMSLSERYKNADDSIKHFIIKEAGEYIYETLLNKIIPHWYGMTWDFSGYSAIPQEGTVGCSYFVSNTLLHCGFNLNRYRLAQADATTIARSIQTNSDIITLRNKNQIELIKYIKKKLKEGMYIIGLDCHVGYILYRKGKVFFIHSSYMFPVEIVIEKAEYSKALESGIYVLGNLTENKILITKWLNNSKVNVLLK